VKRLSLLLAWLSLAAVVVIGVPLFLRTPIWVDVTYHDLSAWNILHGGVHYRDVFETNLPGMVWLHAIVRPIVGWSHEAIRIVDLLVIATVLLILTRLMRRSGVSMSGRIWFLVAAALFYLFESEFIHCQRDGWMMLPALAATCMRLRWLDSRRWYQSVGEGLLWGCAVWIKPHVLVPAFGVWLISLRFQPRRAIMRDALILTSGGLIAGGAGAAWLIWTGAWKPMWDVLLNWNHEYYTWSLRNLAYKLRLVSAYFAPFSLFHFVAIPLAIIAAVRRDPTKAVVAVLYLGWLAQATIIQKEFDYAHAPPTILALAVLAFHRLPIGPIVLAWCLTAGLINQSASNAGWLMRLKNTYPITTHVIIPDHPICRPTRLALWPRCWRDDSWELKDRLTFYPSIHCTPNWTDLELVAEFLRTKNLGDRELICWHDSTHPLYIRLGIKPGIRYPHVITVLSFKSKREQIRQEVFTSPARYVVSDLVPIDYLHSIDMSLRPGPTNAAIADFPEWGPEVYPWNQPIVFRLGRFVVHEIKEPRGRIEFPLPEREFD
jgi:hypothetical protein